MKYLHIIILAFLFTFLVRNAANAQSWIRINQLGYLPNDVKIAVLVSKDDINISSFWLCDAGSNKVVFTGSLVKEYGAWAAFKKSFRLHFTGFNIPGRYYIKAGNTTSPVFKIDSRVYDGTADFLLNYMRQQRSKYNPFLKDSCHTQDGFIVYHSDKKKDSTQLDVAGGWHDASDYLQYLPTSANATYQMLFAYLQAPQSFLDKYDAAGNEGSNGIPDIVDEAKWGLDWMVKMNHNEGEYYNQIADDRDHRGMRLPTLDTVKYATNKDLARPVYFITGKPQGEKYKNKTQGAASSVAKFASAFALGSEVMKPFYSEFAKLLLPKAKAAYEYAKQHPGNTQTISMVSPYIYAEDNYVDDLELAAQSLYKVTGNQHYLKDAFHYAAMEPVTPWMGADTAKHYQWYPFVNMGHYLGGTHDAQNGKIYTGYMNKGIENVNSRGASNPFLMGVPFIWCSNNLTAAIITQISLYKKLTADAKYDELEAAMRDWLFGCNPWGTSMICDLPENGIAPKDPHSAFTHLYNYKISGGLVDGPVYGTIWNRLIGIKLYAPDEFEQFQSPLVVYHDDYGDYSTNEPTMDGTASLSYYLSQKQAEGNILPATDAAGAIVRMPSADKNIYLLFSAHDFGEGSNTVQQILKKHNAKASFFFTGDFFRNRSFQNLIKKIKNNGHYIGVHSDKHLLYADWQKRDSTLVSHTQFSKDIQNALNELKRFGIKKGKWFLPPYEWYNAETVEWARALGLTVINFTPGIGTNADYTTPNTKQYKTSQQLVDKLFAYERASGLNGTLVLVHLGTDPKRTDKFYNRLDEVIGELKKKNYTFKNLP